MAFLNFRRKKGTVRVPLTPEEARERGSRMQYRREWECGCGARLAIRAKDDRMDGASNFAPFPEGHKHEGHSQILSGQLSWNGMAEERGWQTGEVVKCPACQAGVSLSDYKATKRDVRLRLLDHFKQLGIPIQDVMIGSLTNKSFWQVEPKELRDVARPHILAFKI